MLARKPIKDMLRTETKCSQISAEAVMVAKYTLEQVAQILAQRAGNELDLSHKKNHPPGSSSSSKRLQSPTGQVRK